LKLHCCGGTKYSEGENMVRLFQGGTGIGEKDPMSILDVNWAGNLISKGSEAVG